MREARARNHPPLDEGVFNATYPVGSSFFYHPVITEPNSIPILTRSRAWTIGTGRNKTAIVLVAPVAGDERQIAGGVALRSLEKP